MIPHENHQKTDFCTSKHLRNLLVPLLFSAPGPPGPHIYQKVPIPTPFHQNGGEFPIFHLQTAFWGVKMHFTIPITKKTGKSIGPSNVREHHILMEFSENS